MESKIVDVVEGGELDAFLGREPLHVTIVAVVKCTQIAQVREFSINSRVFRGEIGLVEVPGVLHIGAPEALLEREKWWDLVSEGENM